MQVDVVRTPSIEIPPHLRPVLQKVRAQAQDARSFRLRVRAYASVPHDHGLRDLGKLLTARPKSGSKRPPPPYCVAETRGRTLCLPRALGLSLPFPRLITRCSPGEPLADKGGNAISLRDYQTTAVEAVCRRLQKSGPQGALLVAACGAGKTVMAIEVIRRMGVRAAVVVHKDFLMRQWQERIATFLPSAAVGRVQGGRADVGTEYGIVLCMMQTLVQRDELSGRLDGVGLVIYDETHHVCARTFARSLRHFPARCRLGLTATPDRADGLGYLISWMVGPVVCSVRRSTADGGAVEVHRVPFGGSVGKMVLNRMGEPCFSSMVTKLLGNKERNHMLASLVSWLVRVERRKVLLASGRRKHLGVLRGLLVDEMGVDSDKVGLYVGETSKGAKKRRDEGAAGWDVVLTTFKMGEEGLDLPHLDTLVVASPKKTVEQLVGRVTRKVGAGGARIYDVADSRVVMFSAMHRRRCGHYVRMGYRLMC